MLVIGEIQTSLLHHSIALPAAAAVRLLDLSPGRRVLQVRRPVPRVVSAEYRTGVDCRLSTASGAKATCVGNVGSHAAITAGSVLQSSAFTHVLREPTDRRRSWSHYAGLPHTVQLRNRADPADLARGFLAAGVPGTTLDLQAVSMRLLDTVQNQVLLDHVTSLRTRTTRVRWVARAADVERPTAAVRLLDEDDVRTVELAMPVDQLDRAADFCEDFALHDWLLTALSRVVEITAPGARTDDLGLLAAAMERLFPPWMPGALGGHALPELWQSLEHVTGLDRQWNVCQELVRDRVALLAARAAGAAAVGGGPRPRPFREGAPAHGQPSSPRTTERIPELADDPHTRDRSSQVGCA